MARCRGLIVVALLATTTVSAADPSTLIDPAAAWQWQVVVVPALPRQLGALAIHGLDRVAGRQVPADVVAPPPARWPYDLDAPALAALPAVDAGQRIAAAFGITRFTVGPDAAGLTMLELRIRYEDGVALWLNGTEVARRALPHAGGTSALATTPHGPEWETFRIPVAPGLLHPGSNTLAVQIHPSARRAAPTFAAELAGRRDRGVVHGPVLAEATPGAATIAVETDPGVGAILEWGVGDASDRTLASPAGQHHHFELTGLVPNTRYGYRVVAGATRTERFVFHTLPRPGEVMRIGIYGDVRGGHAVHRRLIDQMLGEGLDLVLVTGDMVLRGSDEADWQRFGALAGEMLAQLPYYPAVGNHDLGWDGADSGAHARENFALPPGPPGRPAGTYWYSRDAGDIHLVFLDSNSYDRVEQERWLEDDLVAARRRGVRAILVLTHDGPYARGYHGGNPIARDRYVPVLARHGVDLVFSGHDHIYQRGETAGLRYVVSGGGGAPLYGIRCGVAGRPRCARDDGMLAVAKEHHYVVLVVGARDAELCTRRPDGTLLEKCVRFPLGGARKK